MATTAAKSERLPHTAKVHTTGGRAGPYSKATRGNTDVQITHV
jgi:hypothetical protein